MVYLLEKASKIAISVRDKLAPYCEVINIAGSIRRGKAEVGDIEIVCIPKRVQQGSKDLFGEGETKMVIHPGFVSVVKSLGKIESGKTDGRYMKIQLVEKIQLDLFMPQPIDYWRQFAIRTGSADYSHKVIATGWLRLGWVGTPNGLRRKEECQEIPLPNNKRTWKCVSDSPTLPKVWESEKDFFDWLNVPYKNPSLRYV